MVDKNEIKKSSKKSEEISRKNVCFHWKSKKSSVADPDPTIHGGASNTYILTPYNFCTDLNFFSIS